MQSRIFEGISCFAFNQDCSMLAVCPMSQQIWIYQTQGQTDSSKWKKTQVLNEHLNIVSALDWHPQKNLLLSVSTDRGAIVWNIEGNQLRPNLVAVKEKKANIDGKWNRRGDKFCIATSSGNVFICTYSQANNFWIGEQITGKKHLHSSSVVSVCFDPQSSRVCASVSTDGHCKITTCYNKDIDIEAKGPFGEITSFGEVLIKLKTQGWPNFITFSPSGSTICYCTQESELNFIDGQKAAQKEKEKPEKIQYKGHPFACGMFIDDSKFIGCGYDKAPFFFKMGWNGKWTQEQILDEGITQVKQSQIAIGEFEKSKVFFKNKEQMGTNLKLDESLAVKEMNTRHQNFINQMKVYQCNQDQPSIIATSDINGTINYWNISQI